MKLRADGDWMLATIQFRTLFFSSAVQNVKIRIRKYINLFVVLKGVPGVWH
jgi:tRNA splicing ligase